MGGAHAAHSIPRTECHTLGIGVLSAKARASSAFLASLLDTVDTCERLAHNFAKLFKLNKHPHLEQALAIWSLKSGLTATSLAELEDDLKPPAKADSSKPAQPSPRTRKTQARLSDLVTNHRAQCIINNCEDKRLEQLRKECAHPRAKQWLKNPLSRFLHEHIEHVAYCRRIAFHCGMTLCPHGECPRHGCRTTMDPYGAHLLRCKRKSSSKDNQHTWRHNHIVKLLVEWLERAGKRVEVEEPWKDKQHPTDWRKGIRPDITVKWPGQPNVYIEATVTAPDDGIGPKISYDSRIDQKIKKYKAILDEEQDSKLIVVAITAGGGWIDDEALKYFGDIVATVANRSGVSVGIKKTAFFGTIAAALARSLGRTLQDVSHIKRVVDSNS